MPLPKLGVGTGLFRCRHAYTRRLAQTISAQAIAAVDRHRQLGSLFGAPAVTRQAAPKLRSTTGTIQLPSRRIC
jgi:hypothetical protein